MSRDRLARRILTQPLASRAITFPTRQRCAPQLKQKRWRSWGRPPRQFVQNMIAELGADIEYDLLPHFAVNKDCLKVAYAVTSY